MLDGQRQDAIIPHLLDTHQELPFLPHILSRHSQTAEAKFCKRENAVARMNQTLQGSRTSASELQQLVELTCKLCLQLRLVQLMDVGILSGCFELRLSQQQLPLQVSCPFP